MTAKHDLSPMLRSDLEGLQRRIHANSVAKGFWSGSDNRNIPTKLVLIHSEVSEALEAHRKGNPPSEKTPAHSQMCEEIADVVVRCFDLAEAMGWELGQAILDKMEYNAGRPPMHGGKAY